MHGGMLLIPKEQAQAKYAASVFLFGYKFINRELFVFLTFSVDAFTVVDAVWLGLSF